MYVLRHMVENRLEVHDSMVLGFVDLENVSDTVPKEMVMVTLRWMGVPEAASRMGEGSTRRQQQEWWTKEHRRSVRSKLDSDRAAC